MLMRLRQMTWLLKFHAMRFFWYNFCEPGLQVAASLRGTIKGGTWTAGVGHWSPLCSPCGPAPAPWPTPAVSVSMSVCTLLHWLSFGSVGANEEDKDSSWIKYSTWFSLYFSITLETNLQLCSCWCVCTGDPVRVEQLGEHPQGLCKDTIQCRTCCC